MKFLELSPIKICFMVVDEERWKAKFSNNFNNSYIFSQNYSPVNIQQACQCLLLYQAKCKILGRSTDQVPGLTVRSGQMSGQVVTIGCVSTVMRRSVSSVRYTRRWFQCQGRLPTTGVSRVQLWTTGFSKWSFSKHLWNACYVPCSKDEKWNMNKTIFLPSLSLSLEVGKANMNKWL